MSNDPACEQIESILRKLTWAQEILAVAQDSADKKTADILSGISFIINSAQQDAHDVFQRLD